MTSRHSPCPNPQIHANEEGAGMATCCIPRPNPQIQPSEIGSGLTCARAAAAASLLDDDDMMREILLRLPPRPSSLPRAAAVCRRWRCLLTDPKFLRQFYAHHRKPPLLGFFFPTNQGMKFNPILGHPDRIPQQCFNLGRCSSRDSYNLLDCRHGLVLLKNSWRKELVVCDPITGEQRVVPIPTELKTHYFKGAVLCAAGDQGHVHGGCHSSPFKVVLMSTYLTYNKPHAIVYSSKAGGWGNIISTKAPCKIFTRPAVLVGSCLYWLSLGNYIIEFDSGKHNLNVFRGPPVRDDILYQNCQIIQAKDGTIGFAIFSYLRFEMWERNINGRDVAIWVLWKTIEMHTILRPPSTHEGIYVKLLGYDEDDVVLLCYGESVYMVQLKSVQSRKLDEIYSTGNRYFPFKSFFTPGTTIAGGCNGDEMLHTG